MSTVVPFALLDSEKREETGGRGRGRWIKRCRRSRTLPVFDERERERESVRERASERERVILITQMVSERAVDYKTKRITTMQYRRGHRMRRRVKRLDGSFEYEFVFLSSLLLCHSIRSFHHHVKVEFSRIRVKVKPFLSTLKRTLNAHIFYT